jgi:hypothetical protein
MTVAKLAWGTFVFAHATGHDQTYQDLVADVAFLDRLQTNPKLDDFERLRTFLTQYGVHYAPKDLANQYLAAWPTIKPYITQLSGMSLTDCDLCEPNTRNAISAVFGHLVGPAVWGGGTVTSKMLHFFNVKLFMMTDAFIASEYGGFGPAGYLSYLTTMQTAAKEVQAEFAEWHPNQSLEEYLASMLGYQNPRPLTKLLDDYNWVTITRRWPEELPNWLGQLPKVQAPSSTPSGLLDSASA